MKIKISETPEKDSHSITDSIDHYLGEGLEARMEGTTYVNICDDKGQMQTSIALPKEGKGYASVVAELGPEEARLPPFELEVPDKFLCDECLHTDDEKGEPKVGNVPPFQDPKNPGLGEVIKEITQPVPTLAPPKMMSSEKKPWWKFWA